MGLLGGRGRLAGDRGSPVDWIYRDVRRVRRAWSDARVGRFGFHTQADHPFGVPDFAYAGEVALGIVLADPTGERTAMQGETLGYPPKLAEALVDGLWEAHFLSPTPARPRAVLTPPMWAVTAAQELVWATAAACEPGEE